MDILITLAYLLFTICVIYPPTEFVSAGFTIAQLFDSYLVSENVNFMGYHMKKITITALVHSALPLGYITCLYFGGEGGSWMLAAFAATSIIPLLMVYKIVCWWEKKTKHPAVRALVPYESEGSDWRVVAAQLNTEFRGVDKVSVPLTATSKLIATETWLIKVSSYSLNIVKQSDCALVATNTDIPDLTASGEEETQFVNIQVIPSRDDISPFMFRVTTAALRDLQPRLAQPEPEVCIGCMQAPADVKLSRRCLPPPPGLQGGPPECQQCHCRVLWCCSCMARWWAARAGAAGGPRGVAGGALQLPRLPRQLLSARRVPRPHENPVQLSRA
ncbi:hypothetical protein MSG28_001343 [Choristoneura fumiferana]|uniref:Uncharacterized protein n=1 Tax=Choristoneura fumiferana TaxID=7141 RepID=A0ACC0KUB5_CHOFU|nr:hypothetical protein MSG28_001343 [Choristoneura fumiferana]